MTTKEYQYENGHHYSGEFKDRLFDGKGTLTMGNYKYVGDFKKGKIHGSGELYRNGQMISAGQFENDRCTQGSYVNTSEQPVQTPVDQPAQAPEQPAEQQEKPAEQVSEAIDKISQELDMKGLL